MSKERLVCARGLYPLQVAKSHPDINHSRKAHKVVCPKPDAARLEYIAIVEKTINAVAPLLDFENAPMTDPGNEYLQILVRLACLSNHITIVNDKAKIVAAEFRFDYIPRCCRADPTGTWHTLLQLTSMRCVTHASTPYIFTAEAIESRAKLDAKLHASTGVYGDPTCCHIPVVFGSQKSKDAQDRTSLHEFVWIPVLPGVVKKAVQEMKESGMSEDKYAGMLVK